MRKAGDARELDEYNALAPEERQTWLLLRISRDMREVRRIVHTFWLIWCISVVIGVVVYLAQANSGT